MTDNLPPTDPVVIEPALQSELAEILALYRDAGIDSGRPLDQAEAEGIFTRMCSYPDYRLYVANAHIAKIKNHMKLPESKLWKKEKLEEN